MGIRHLVGCGRSSGLIWNRPSPTTIPARLDPPATASYHRPKSRNNWSTQMAKEFIVSGDSHTNEPTDLYLTRLPKHMRDRALWEEEFVLEEPLVPGGHTEFRI